MASPVVVDPGPVADGNIDASADARFESIRAQAAAEVAPIPPTPPSAPVQPETPAVAAPVPPVAAQPVAAPSEATPPAAPASPAATAPVITIDLNSLTPELRQSWENALTKTNGDANQVAKLMWEFNNRLSELSKAPQGATPAAQPEAPVPPAPPPAPVQPVEERIDAELAQVVPQDQRVITLKAEHSATIEDIRTVTKTVGIEFDKPVEALRAVNAALQKLEREVDRYQFRLGESDVKEDEDKRNDYERKLTQAERSQAKLERLRDKVDGLEGKFASRRSELRDSIADRLYQEHQIQKADQEARDESARYQRDFMPAFLGYAAAAAKTAEIAPELAAQFQDYAKAQTLLAANVGKVDLAQDSLPAQLPGFLATVAQSYVKLVEDHARIHAAVVARKAAGANGAPPIIIPDGSPAAHVLGTNGGVPASGPSVPQRAADIDEQADARASALLQNMRA